jgi:hypothetical protein
VTFSANYEVQKAVKKQFTAFKQTEKTFSRFQFYLNYIINSVRDRKAQKDAEYFNYREITEQIFKFCKGCCEGHNETLQDYFRCQSNIVTQFNFLKAIVDLLSGLANDINSDNLELLNLSFDCLIELLQGPNRTNQEFILESPILEVLSKFMMLNQVHDHRQKKHEDTNELKSWQILKIKHKTIVLLSAICEIPDKPERVYSKLSKFFSIHLLIVFLEQSYQHYRKLHGPELQYDALKKVAWPLT